MVVVVVMVLVLILMLVCCVSGGCTSTYCCACQTTLLLQHFSMKIVAGVETEKESWFTSKSGSDSWLISRKPSLSRGRGESGETPFGPILLAQVPSKEEK